MFVRIDACYSSELEGFSYINRDGSEECVRLTHEYANSVDIEIDNDIVTVYVEDIPNLIKALQAAYNHKEGLQNG